MNDLKQKKGYLILEDGTVFEGFLFGAENECVGELVFTTKTDYMNVFTDPNHCSQIVISAFPIGGSYGFNSYFSTPQTHLKGFIVKNWCQEPSNFKSEGNLDTFFMSNNITGFYGTDTRRLVKIVRDKGRVYAKISSSKEYDKNIKTYKPADLIKSVSTKAPYTAGNGRFKIAVLDFGIKNDAKDALINRNCTLNVLPYNTSISKIKAMNPDGILLSDGPEELDNADIICLISDIIKLKVPTLGIGLSHLLAAAAHGLVLNRLKIPHRGNNQPVIDLRTNKIYVTSQNHAYEIQDKNTSVLANIMFKNVNDNSIEGLYYKDINCCTVQFMPKNSGGGLDTNFIFDKFVSMTARLRN